MKTECFPRELAFEEFIVVAASCPHESSVYPLSLAKGTDHGRRGLSPNSLAIAASDKHFHQPPRACFLLLSTKQQITGRNFQDFFFKFTFSLLGSAESEASKLEMMAEKNLQLPVFFLFCFPAKRDLNRHGNNKASGLYS